MNAKNRNEIKKWIEQLDEIHTAIEYMQEEETEKYDNMPEGIQDSEKGDAMTEAIENLESAAESLDDCIESLNNIE